MSSWSWLLRVLVVLVVCAWPTGELASQSRSDAVAVGYVTGYGLAAVVLVTTYSFDPLNDHCVFIHPQSAAGRPGAPTRYPHAATASDAGIVLVDLDIDGFEPGDSNAWSASTP